MSFCWTVLGWAEGKRGVWFVLKFQCQSSLIKWDVRKNRLHFCVCITLMEYTCFLGQQSGSSLGWTDLRSCLSGKSHTAKWHYMTPTLNDTDGMVSILSLFLSLSSELAKQRRSILFSVKVWDYWSCRRTCCRCWFMIRTLVKLPLLKSWSIVVLAPSLCVRKIKQLEY